MKKAYKTKLMINITDKIKQDKNRQYRKKYRNVIYRERPQTTWMSACSNDPDYYYYFLYCIVGEQK